MIAAIEEKNFQKCVTSSAMYSNLLLNMHPEVAMIKIK